MSKLGTPIAEILIRFSITKKFLTFSLLVPVTSDGRRRHSYQSGAAGGSALARDMERLRVNDGGAPQAGARPGISPKPSKKRRASTRRSSRSGWCSILARICNFSTTVVYLLSVHLTIKQLFNKL